MMETKTELLQILDWEGEGYQPLVTYGSWLVALMNWERRFDIKAVGKIERHNQTDEVFVLIHGRSVLFVLDGSTMEVVDMQPGVIYNVPAGTWHNVIGTRETRWLIVENSDTSVDNSEYRDMSLGELQSLKTRLPGWLSAGEN